jgi:hypothetical protein
MVFEGIVAGRERVLIEKNSEEKEKVSVPPEIFENCGSLSGFAVIESDRVSPDARLAAGQRVRGAVELLVVAVVLFAEGAEGLFARPAVDGEIGAGNVGVAQQFRSQIIWRAAEESSPGSLRPIGSFKRGNLLLGNLELPKASNPLQIGELLHQLLHAVPVEQDGELGVFAVALAHENGAFAVFAVADALAFFQAGGACRLADLHG